MIKWDETFKNAHLESWPIAMLGMSIEIYRRDKKQVDECAKKYGYIKQGETQAHIDFIKWPIQKTEFNRALD